MNDNILKICNIYKNFNGLKAVYDFSDNLKYREILGLIGPNGAGKTTLFNLVSGFLVPDSGSIHLKSINLSKLPAYSIARNGISRTFQNLRLIMRLSVLDNVIMSFQKQTGEQIRQLFFKRKLIEKQEAVNREKALSLLNQIGLYKKAKNYAEELSYGQQKLLSITCCLAMNAEVILLDEPIAGIAPELAKKILSIIRSLPEKGKSVIVIEHDIDAINSICDRVIFMESGMKVSEGTPTQVRNDPKVIKAYID